MRSSSARRQRTEYDAKETATSIQNDWNFLVVRFQNYWVGNGQCSLHVQCGNMDNNRISQEVRTNGSYLIDQ